MPRSPIGSALRSTRVRETYYRASQRPVLRHVAKAFSRLLVPQGPRWTNVPAGMNEGRALLVDPRTELGYLRGDHEPWLQQQLAEWLGPGDEYLDVGSHIGFFALLAARIVGDSGRVVAIEADPETFERLRAHVDRNAARVVECVQAAAWSTDGRVQFAQSSDDAGVRGAVANTATGLEVRAIKIDDCARAPAAVKIDVEGGEVEALRGAERVLSEGRTKWIVEVHSDDLAVQVTEIFERHGYQTELTSPEHPVYDDYRQDYVLAVPANA